MAKATLPTIPREIRGSVYDTIRKQFSQPATAKSKATWTENFVQKLFKEALSNPNGEIGKLLAKNLLQDDILTNLDAQTEKLLSRDIDFLEYRVVKQCFKEQRDVLLDTNRPRKIIMTSRRAGKTSAAARLIVFACTTPETPCLYIHIKFDNAIRQCFDDVIEVAKQAELNIERSSKAEGLITFSNGSSVQFKGNSDKSAADRLRGGKFKVIIIDEAAFQCNARYLCEDIALPMLADFRGSQILLISTPPRVPHTYFEQCWRSEEWTKYSWTAMQNPFIPDFKQFIDDICIKKGLSIQSPFIRREFYGELIYDTEAQVYKDAKTYNKIPKDFKPTDCAIGVDFGFSDYNSIISLVFNRDTGDGFVIKSRKFNKSNVTTIVDTAKAVYDESLKFCLDHNSKFELNKIWFYCDTSDQSISYEMSTKYKLPISNALKYDKKLGIEQLADLLRVGKIRIKDDDNILLNEIDQTVYKRDELDAIIPEIDDTQFHPDALDALLYASRQYVYACNLTEPETKNAADDVFLGIIDGARKATLPTFMQENNDDNYIE